jgi:diaminopimelate epimerase
MNNSKEYLIAAAGGNATAIEVIDSPRSSEWYAKNGKILGEKYDPLGAEQAGFIIPSRMHFQMAGGEFCGNATRAAAIIFSALGGESEVSYTVSGFSGVVNSSVEKISDVKYDVVSSFPHMEVGREDVVLAAGTEVSVVDLGGIVHVVIGGALPDDYGALHRAITEELGLRDRAAVGVVWYRKVGGGGVRIDPIVWVKAVDTFYYETSCGSGTIAVAMVTGERSIIQVTGKSIGADIDADGVRLFSEMEVLHH